MPLSPRIGGRLAALFAVTTVLLAAALGWSWWWFDRLSLRTMPKDPPPAVNAAAGETAAPSPLLMRYQLDLPGRGEIFPALVAGNAKDYWPLAILSVTNQGDRPVLQALSAVVEGWTGVTQQTVVVGPKETRSIQLTPDLLPKAFSNAEVRRAQLKVRVQNATGELAFATDRPVLLHSGSDLYWGRKFANAQYVARWVTPHDAAVLKLVANAKRRAPGGRLNGYSTPRNASPGLLEAQVRRQVRAVFEALRASGITYVSSIYTFGDYVGQAQRIRLPSETLELQSANCIDVTVAFASAMENLGMNPVVVIVPGHAFAGVRLGPQSQATMYLDLTVLPKGTLEQAEARAMQFLRKNKPEQVLTVDVAAARMLKIYPLPSDGDTRLAQAPAEGTREETPTAE